MSEPLIKIELDLEKAIATISTGLTDLDWFAGQALAGYRIDNGRAFPMYDEIAAQCYTMASAMIEERENWKGGSSSAENL